MHKVEPALRCEPQDFLRIRTLLRDWAGISYSEAKQPLVYRRLAGRLHELGLTRFADYLDQVEADTGEREHFFNALTTNLTAFFREAHHFPILSRLLLEKPAQHPIRIWCCATSTGEEAYSLAMTAWDTLGEAAAQRVEIIASDLDTQVLERAQKGIYRVEQLQPLPPEQVRRFFLKGAGRNTGWAKVKPELQKLITFRRINLLDSEWPIPQSLDVIFCRNVMIYFEKKTQLTVLERFAPLLKKDGRLFAGHSESLPHAAHLFRPCDRSVYRCSEVKGQRA